MAEPTPEQREEARDLLLRLMVRPPFPPVRDVVAALPAERDELLANADPA